MTFPEAVPVCEDVDTLKTEHDVACYLLWMLDQIQTFKGRGLVGKRGRWIGYIQSVIEAMELTSSDTNRTLTRQDVADKKE